MAEAVRTVNLKLTWETWQPVDVPEGADVHAWLASGAWMEQVAIPATGDLTDWNVAGYIADMG